MGDVTNQNHLEACQAVIAQRTTDKNPILGSQLVDLYAVVQHYRSVD